MEPEEKERKKVHRSPNYPAFSLADAIKKAKTVYDHEKRSLTTGEVIAKHLGYSQTTGPGGRALSGLRAYGLIEEDMGRFRISDTGFNLIHYPDDSSERAAALQQAVRRPTLFRELLSEYPTELPSDATLKSNLLRRGFNPAMIDEAVKSFRDSVNLAYGKNVAYTDLEKGNSEDPMAGSQVQESQTKTQSGMIGTRQDVFSLAEGPVTIQWPATLSADSYQDLADWLDILKRKIGRSVNASTTATG